MDADASQQEGTVDQPCAGCDGSVVVSDGLGVCDLCGLVRGDSNLAASAAEDTPAGIEIVPADGPTRTEPDHPYREPAPGDEPLEFLVDHRSRPFGLRTSTLALSAVAAAVSLDIPVTVRVGTLVVTVALVAWSLVPRESKVRFVATTDALGVGPDGVPRHRCRNFDADAIEGIFVRALSRTDQPEDRRFELVVLDDTHTVHRLLSGLEDPRRALWIAANLTLLTCAMRRKRM